MVLTAASVGSDRAGLCEECWAGQKNEKYPPVLAGRTVPVLHLSASGKWCPSDLDGVCSLASLQPHREAGGEAYRNTTSTFLFGQPTFLHSWALSCSKRWSCFDVGGAGHFPSWALDPGAGSQPSSHWAHLMKQGCRLASAFPVGVFQGEPGFAFSLPLQGICSCCPFSFSYLVLALHVQFCLLWAKLPPTQIKKLVLEGSERKLGNVLKVGWRFPHLAAFRQPNAQLPWLGMQFPVWFFCLWTTFMRGSPLWHPEAAVQAGIPKVLGSWQGLSFTHSDVLGVVQSISQVTFLWLNWTDRAVFCALCMLLQ